MSITLAGSHGEQPSRRVSLEGQTNFRDLGGYEAAGGRTVKSELIYRSGELSKLTDEDIAVLQDLGIKTVVDFRSADEVEFLGTDRLPEGVQYIALPIDPGNLGPILYDAVRTGDASLLSDNILADANRAIISDSSVQMSELFKVLSDPTNLPLLFHCTHGKDRTGVASAILLMALGVSPDVAEKDYLQSNEYRRTENEKQLADLRHMVAASQGVDQSEADMSKFNPLFYLEPSYFDAILDEIKKRYGSLESYLENGLAVDGSQVKELQQRLTEQKIRGTTPLTATRSRPG